MPKLRFNNVRVDIGARQVFRGAEPVHLTRKAFDLLVLLIERRPETVSKEDIHQHLWPDTFVSEASLQALVSEVRQAVGDSGRKRAIVRTVHAVGYAFNADVALDADAESVAEQRVVRAWLVGELSRIPLYAGETVLGRGDDGVTMVDDTTVSRRHARVVVDADGVTIEDLGSRNGTWLVDQPLTGRAPVRAGDSIRLGSARFTYRPVAGTNSTQPVKPEPPQ
jgi:DNA-binding winged helix-turn-helix (wHTH) protein